MKSLNLTRLVFARDVTPFYQSQKARDNLATNDIVDSKLAESAARFLAVCYLCGIQPEELHNFTEQELAQTIALAQKILQSV